MESPVFDLDVSDDRLAVVALGRSLGLDLLSPASKDAERAGAVPDAILRTLHETGLTVPVAEAFGGGGLPDIETHLAAVEVLSYGDPGITMAAIWAGAGAILIGRCATPDQAATWLPSLATDPAARCPVALYEGFGRAPSEPATTISRTDGGWRVVGRKVAVAFAAEAASLVVVGTDPATDGRLRAAIVARPAERNGVRIEREDDRLALGASPLCTVTFDLVIGDDELLGGADSDGAGLEIAIGWVRLTLAAAQCGMAQRATDYASKYATERIAFGKPIAAFQGVSFMLADAALRVGAARLELFDTAAHLNAGTSRSEGPVSRAVNYAGVVACAVTRDAIQVLGGHGFITDHPVEIWYRCSAALSAIDFDPLLSNFEPAL